MVRITDSLDDWVAQDGLLRLNLKDRAKPFAGDLETIHSENGILWVAYLALVRPSWAKANKQQIDDTIAYTESFGRKGLYDRHHGNQRLRNAKDSYIGTLWLSVQLSLRYHKDIYNYGKSHAWNYQNIKSDLPRIETQMQGSFVGLVKATQRVPLSLIEKTWLAGAICWSTDLLQVYIMTRILDECGYHDKMYMLARGKFLKRFNLAHEIKVFFADPSHPCRVALGV
jgi:hypothetical protein